MDLSNQDREMEKKNKSKGTVSIHRNISKATKGEILYLTRIFDLNSLIDNYIAYHLNISMLSSMFFYLKENNENKMNILYFLTNYYDEFFVI